MKTKTNNLVAAGVLAALGLGIAGAQADTDPVSDGDWRSYAVYDPNVTLVSIHHGGTNISDPTPREYNSCASVEWFDGRFYCVWNHNPTTFSEGWNQQRLAIAYSDDFKKWTAPALFVENASLSENPLPVGQPGVKPGRKDNAGQGAVLWQPNLLNYRGEELWCVWSGRFTDANLDGFYVSKLPRGAGAKWRHHKVMGKQSQAGVPNGFPDYEGKGFGQFVCGNPYVCSSGRVLVPVTCTRRVGEVRMGLNACAWTDDGISWQLSNPVSSPGDMTAQWEPYFFEQANGALRMFSRNLQQSKRPGLSYPPPTELLFTAVGSGASKGEPVTFSPNANYSHMEVNDSRPVVMKLQSGRYLMMHHDVHTRDAARTPPRYNAALYFSRTGMDDFIAGPPITTPANFMGYYPQGVEKDGRLYVAFTTQPIRALSIGGAIVDSLPDAKKYYLYFRAKDAGQFTNADIKPERFRLYYPEDRLYPEIKPAKPQLLREEGREVIRFTNRACAGVDTDPVSWLDGDSLTLEFDVRVDALQPEGNLIFCSFGDQMPIRIGMPSFRPGKLYAYSRAQWSEVGDLPLKQWRTLRIVFRQDKFTVSINSGAERSFENPQQHPNPRLYLGDGYEVDSIPSNWRSDFRLGLSSVRTRVVREKMNANR